MTASGVIVTVEDGSPTGAPAPSLAAAGIVGPTLKGPADKAVPVYSKDHAVRIFGPKQGSSYLIDAIDEEFQTGASVVYVSRDVAADATIASTMLNNSSTAAVLAMEAPYPGAWANAVTVDIVGTGPYSAIVKYSGVEVERAEGLTSTTDQITAFANSNYVRFRQLGGSGLPQPVTAAGFLTAGTDGSALSTSSLQTALARFLPSITLGQIHAPGYTTPSSINAIADHCGATGRQGQVDAPVSGSTYSSKITNAIAAGQALQAHAAGKQMVMHLSPGITPGGPNGTTRSVPWSAIQCALTAESDRSGHLPGTPIAGANGQAPRVIGLVLEPQTDADRDALKAAGVTYALMRPAPGGGTVATVYEDRAVTTAQIGQNNRNASDWRLLMAIEAEAQALGEPFNQEKINTGNLRLLDNALRGIGGKYYDDGLVGTPEEQQPYKPKQTYDEAFAVSVSGNSHTQEFLAVIAVTIARTGEVVRIKIRNQPIGG